MKTESENRLEQELKDMMKELFDKDLFPGTRHIMILTPKEGVPLDKVTSSKSDS